MAEGGGTKREINELKKMIKDLTKRIDKEESDKKRFKEDIRKLKTVQYQCIFIHPVLLYYTIDLS